MELVTNRLQILNEEDKKDLDVARISEDEKSTASRKLYIESYGCQMNFADSEIVASILRENDFATTSKIEEAELILLNTCAIRDNAEQKIRHRLQHLVPFKNKRKNVKIGILGCMAERLKTKLLEEEKIVDMVVGPDAYRDLPNLINEVEEGHKAVNVFLSREETYADVTPIRLNSNGVTAMISIMRGCDNMCSFCVVPYTRGRERSRDPHSIVKEATDLFNEGYREVTLLGQNVDSYKWQATVNSQQSTVNSQQSAVSKSESYNTQNSELRTQNSVVTFANLLEMVAQIHPDLRVRFSTSHPKDITDEVLYTIKKYENVCNYIHLPAQSGSSRILELMNRTYDREWYMGKIDRIREILGQECGISQDIITGFCTETEEDHQETLSLLDYVKYDYGYMFAYSERPNTPAAKKLKDDVSDEVKSRRLAEIIARQREHSLERNQLCVGKTYKVLVEGFSKRSEKDLSGRNDQNKIVVFPRENFNGAAFRKGDYVNVLITECSSGTLIGKAV